MSGSLRRLVPLSVVLVCAAWLQLQPAFAADQAGPSPPAPAGIAVDADGDVYVSDYTQDRIVKFGGDGTVVAQWGSTGTGPGQFNAPFGVAVDERNTVFVVDQLNHRVQRFTTDGGTLGTWGSSGAGAGELRTPFGVAAGGGRIYVADFGNDRVQVFSPDGTLVGSLGAGRGSGEGQFQRPAGVTVDRDGTLFVTDHFNDRVEKFSSEGRFQAQLGPVLANPSNERATTAAVVVSTSSSTPPSPPGDVKLRRPEGIALDRDGNLWVADYGRDRVLKLAADGRLLLTLGDRGSGPGEFVGPKGVAIDPSSGKLYVADTGNARIQRLAPDGTPEAAWPMP